MNEAPRDREVLIELGHDLKDSIDGYREAAYLAGEEKISALFRQRCESREKILERVEQRVALLPTEEAAIIVAEANAIATETAPGRVRVIFQQFREQYPNDQQAALARIEEMEEQAAEQLRQMLALPLSLEVFALLTDFLTAIDMAYEQDVTLKATA